MQVLPPKFCGDHLPKSTVDLVLENKEGSEYGVVYIGHRTAFSGLGWRTFALDHKLAECDALVFELIEPTRFKVGFVLKYVMIINVSLFKDLCLCSPSRAFSSSL